MSEHVVDVFIENHEITVSPTTVHVNPNDTIRWQGVKGVKSFLIVFRDGSLSPEMRSEPGELVLDPGRCVHASLAATKGTGKVGPVATGVASEARGAHPYQVVLLGERGDLYVDTGCPEVIIR